MAWPLSQDYNEAIQDCAACFGDPELKQGEAVCNALGLPVPCSGNFADVYAVTSGPKKWAVKCFTREIPGLQERYAQISKYLKQVNLPFMVEFTFLEKGIRVRNEWYPVLKMQWVEGFQLNTFVKDNLDKPQTLQNLCQIWVKLAARLTEANLAHGDLQHGNVLLVPGLKAGMLSVRLVDYDGMCVPALEQLKSMEVGHPCYQHPQRLKDGGYGLHIDRFSHLVIYTALRALAISGKALWEPFDSGDNLLFKQRDFEAPDQAAIFQELQKVKDPQVPKLAAALLNAARGPLDQVPLLADLLPKEAPPAPPPPAAPARPPVAAKTAPTPPPVPEIEAPVVRSKYQPKQGMSPLPIILGVSGMTVILLGVFLFFLMRGSPAARTEVVEVEPTVPTIRRPIVRSTEPVEPPTQPDTQPKTDPNTEPPPAPLPKPVQKPAGLGGVGVREYRWVPGVRPTSILPAGDGFCVLGAIGGGWHGLGEQAGVQVKDGRWWLFGQAGQGSMHASALAIETLRRSDFDLEIKEYTWHQNDPPVKMLGRLDGFCFLSFVGGKLHGGGEEVGVFLRDGYWQLGGRAGAPLAARAIAVRSQKKGSFRTRVKEYTWKAGGKPVKMISRSEGFCFLSTVGGHFKAGGEEVRVRVGDDNFWYLEGRTGQASLVAKAMSVALLKDDESAAEERDEVPDAESLARAEKNIKEIYAKEYAKTSPTDRLNLANKLLEQGRNAKEDPPTRYALLDQARKIAADIARARTALRAVDEIARDFLVNVIDMKLAVLEILADKTGKPADLQALVGHILAVVDDAVGADNFEGTAKLLKLGEAVARSSKIPAALNSVQEQAREVEALRKAFEKLTEADEALAKDPADATASLFKGKYLCFVRADWARGLPLLAQGADAKLKDLAAHDLKGTDDAAEQVVIGDAWFDLAEADTGRRRTVLYRRANHWYELAFPRLGNVAQARLEKRIKTMIDHGALPPRFELRITAVIDGKDEVRISSTESRWTHMANGWPTQVKINKFDWAPQRVPVVRGYGTRFLLGQQVDVSTARLLVKRGRGKVEMQIGADYVAITFDDNEEPGADTYEVVVTFEK